MSSPMLDAHDMPSGALVMLEFHFNESANNGQQETVLLIGETDEAFLCYYVQGRIVYKTVEPIAFPKKSWSRVERISNEPGR